ncbi:MAG: beta-ketoacyl-ACP synthase III [Sandaracinaceae bacterium]|nr:beta-ketoacyl-ACP synthase III [Sandaracinaceae bacterium]
MTQPRITGVGSHLPPALVTNEELCGTFNRWARGEDPDAPESSPAFIDQVSGIRARHFWDASGILDLSRMAPRIPDRADEELSVQAELGLAAARKAIADAGVDPTEIDLVIVGASSLQRPYPSIAIEIQAALGARGFAFDCSVGCSSGAYAMQLANDAIAMGRARSALVCVPELPSAYANFRDRDSHFILGDAGAAVVIEAADAARAPGGLAILDASLVSRYSNNVRNNCGFLNRCDEARRDAADKLFYQEGRRVFRDIVKLVPSVIEEQLDRHRLTPSDVTRFWLHQANARLNGAIGERLVGPRAADKFPMVLETTANTAAAGALLALDTHRELAPGQIGVLCAFGAGYTVGSLLLQAL